MTDWDAVRDELLGMTLKDLKALAKEEGICLGYAAGTKATCAGEIVTQLRYRELNGVLPKKEHPWRKYRSVKGGRA